MYGIFGLLYQKQEQFSKSLTYFEKALQLSQSKSVMKGKTISRSSFGRFSWLFKVHWRLFEHQNNSKSVLPTQRFVGQSI
jgi:hypothetical protein